jgi:biotin carboxylase
VARVLLILPTSSYRITDFLEAAEGLGVDVAVASEEHLPLAGLDRFLQVDLDKVQEAADAVVALAVTTPVDAVIPVDDRGVVVAALAAEQLGLPHNPPWAAAATRNKVSMRRALEKAEVPQPTFRVLGPNDDPAALAQEVGFPLVVKPLSLSGSRGVIRVDDPGDVAGVAERVRQINAVACRDPSEPLLLEAFVSGPELAVEGILTKGRLEVLAIFDKPQPLEGPYFEETIYVTPSRIHPEIVEEVVRITAAATAGLGLTEGPIHAELRITDGRPRVIEVAARSIGGICGRSLKFGLLGTSLETLILRHALGRPVHHPGVDRGASGVMMLPIPGPGVLQGVEGIEQATSVAGIRSIEITSPPGTYLRAVPDADRYLGFMFASGRTPEEVTAALLEAHAHLRVAITATAPKLPESLPSGAPGPS